MTDIHRLDGRGHARKARQLLIHTDQSVTDRYGEGAEVARQQLAEAQVHAILGLIAVVAESGNQPAAWQRMVREWGAET